MVEKEAGIGGLAWQTRAKMMSQEREREEAEKNKVMKARAWIFYSSELVRTSMEVKTTALSVLQQQVLDHGMGTARAPSTCKTITSFPVCTQ